MTIKSIIRFHSTNHIYKSSSKSKSTHEKDMRSPIIKNVGSPRQVVIILLTITVLLYTYNISYLFQMQIFSIQGSELVDKVTDRLNFSQMLISFPWKAFEKAGLYKNDSELNNYSTKLINELIPFLIRESDVKINQSCKPPPLDLPESLLNCSIRMKPGVKIGMLLQFGFEADSLEIHLNELYDLVDKFFIVESTRTHFRTLRKPLIWDYIREQDRFSKFLDKVVHIVVDDTNIAEANASIIGYQNPVIDYRKWRMEDIQEKVRWDQFLKWNSATGFFGNEDLLGFGDTDEIPSRRTINFLKNCELGDAPVDIGIWFPYGNIHQALASDFPVEGFPFTLGDPTFWKLRTALDFAKNASLDKRFKTRVPSRNRGKSPSFLLGGMHLSQYGYLPLRIVKKLSATEYGITDDSGVKDISVKLKFGKVREVEKDWAKLSGTVSLHIVQMQASKLEEVAATRRKVAILPWFYDCNRNRYPSWEGGHDLRID